MQNIKQLAYQFLIQAQIKELTLPLDTITDLITKQNIILAKYTESNVVKMRLPDEVWSIVENGRKSNVGISFIYNGIPFILYSDDLSVGEKIYVIHHELGHLTAGHRRSNVFMFEENIVHEEEANEFAYFVMAPPCVLNEIGCISKKRLSRLTGLNEKLAQEASFLVERDKDDKLTQLERQLLTQFDGYIKANKDSESVEKTELNDIPKKHKKLIFGASTAAFVIICVIFGFCIHNSNKQLPKSSPDIATTPTPITAVATPASEMPRSDNNVEKTGQTVWKAKTGDVYHTDPNCYHIPRTAVAMDLGDAIAAGFRKCKDCK